MELIWEFLDTCFIDFELCITKKKKTHVWCNAVIIYRCLTSHQHSKAFWTSFFRWGDNLWIEAMKCAAKPTYLFPSTRMQKWKSDKRMCHIRLTDVYRNYIDIEIQWTAEMKTFLTRGLGSRKEGVRVTHSGMRESLNGPYLFCARRVNSENTTKRDGMDTLASQRECIPLLFLSHKINARPFAELCL